MKITFDWIKDHLDTKFKEDKLLKQLTNVGLEVEGVENLSAGLDLFKIAKILKTEKHPNADRLKVCDVDVGEKEIKKVVCGAPNAREGLITVYAPTGAIVPKSKVKLVVAKIRDVTSYGMLCSESELNLSDESDGIRIKSPIIGTAYLSPEPGAKKFVEVGDKIKKGQTIMIVEAMKTMNHVPSTSDGEVKKILVKAII